MTFLRKFLIISALARGCSAHLKKCLRSRRKQAVVHVGVASSCQKLNAVLPFPYPLVIPPPTHSRSKSTSSHSSLTYLRNSLNSDLPVDAGSGTVISSIWPLPVDTSNWITSRDAGFLDWELRGSSGWFLVGSGDNAGQRWWQSIPRGGASSRN